MKAGCSRGVFGRRGQRLFQIGGDVFELGDRGVVRLACGTLRWPHGRHHHDLLANGIEHGDDAGSGHDAVGQAERIGVLGAQRFDQANEIIADGAEQARGHRGQLFRQIEPRRGDQRAQAVERAAGLRCPRVARDVVALADLGRVAAAAPDQVGREGDDRIAAAPSAALHGFEEERIGLAARDLQPGRDRRLEVVDDAAPDDLDPTRAVGRGERLEPWLRTHFFLGAVGDVMLSA